MEETTTIYKWNNGKLHIDKYSGNISKWPHYGWYASKKDAIDAALHETIAKKDEAEATLSRCNEMIPLLEETLKETEMGQGVYAIKRFSDGFYRHKDSVYYTKDIEDIALFRTRSDAEKQCYFEMERVVYLHTKGA